MKKRGATSKATQGLKAPSQQWKPQAQLEENDDEAERRRRSSVLPGGAAQLQQQPVAAAAPPQRLSPGEIAELLSNVMRMHTSNRITALNCWSLRLTENLPGILETSNNFQTAASAIDASVKIFALRVESVVQETFKLQSGLTRSDGSSLGRDDGAVEEEGGDVGEAQQAQQQQQLQLEKEREKQRKRGAGREAATLMKSEQEMDNNAADQTYEEDPLVKKVSAMYGAPGFRGLLLNQLPMHSGATIVFDSLDAADVAPRSVQQDRAEASKPIMDCDEKLAAQLGYVLEHLEQRSFCPELASFEDSSRAAPWEDDGTAAPLLDLPKVAPRPATQAAFASQLSQPASQMEPVVVEAAAPEEFHGYNDFGGGDDLDDHPHEFDADGNIVPSPHHSNAVPPPAQLQQMQAVLVPEGADNNNNNNNNNGATMVYGAMPPPSAAASGVPVVHEPGMMTPELVRALISGADEYGYNNQQLRFANWMGHGKFTFKKIGPKMTDVSVPERALDVDDDGEDGGAGDGEHSAPPAAAAPARAPKRNPQQFFIDFSVPDPTNWAEAFAAQKRVRNTATKRITTSATTLPPDMRYGPSMLMSLFTKPKWTIPRHILQWKPILDPEAQGQALLGEVVEPAVMQAAAADVADADNAAATDWFSRGQPDDADADAACGFDADGAMDFGDDDGVGAEGDGGGGVMMMGGAMPLTVERTMIGVPIAQRVEHAPLPFARKARAVDVKLLKATLWSSMSSNPFAGATAAGTANHSEQGRHRQSFQELLDELPARMPRFEQSNVTVPFCFISLLHLANEKGLELHSSGLNDLVIETK